MTLRKLLSTSSAAVLGLAVVGIPAAALADDSPGGPVPTVTHPPAGAEHAHGGAIAERLVHRDDSWRGEPTFGVNPSTAALTSLLVTADPGVTAGAPVPRDQGSKSLSRRLRPNASRWRSKWKMACRRSPPRSRTGKTKPRAQGEDRGDNHGDDNGEDDDDDDAPAVRATGGSGREPRRRSRPR